MHRDRRPTPLELALWRHMVSDVEPLVATGSPQPQEPPAATAPPEPPASAPSTTARREAQAVSPQPQALPSPTHLDRRTWQKLRRGQVPISARVDLHGMTQTEAYGLLVTFLRAQHAKGARCVLVITGRGIRSGGVLRQETPRWLSSPPLAGVVMAFAAAHVGHGGEGALYVLLRRQRAD